MKQLLAHINTKQALTEYLADYTLNVLKDTKSVAITFSKQTKTNIQGFNLDLANHDHEEADTLLVLHAIDVGKSNPFQECIVVSLDKDVFLLLVHYYEQLPNSTGFRTGSGKNEPTISVQRCFEALGSKRAEAILGFHVLTGCDQIGRFSGKSKSSWWQEFLKCNEDALIALAKLGDEEVLPSFSTLDNIERLVVAVYGEKKKSENIERLVRLCWYFFSKFQSDAPQLPSVMSALKYKIF